MKLSKEKILIVATILIDVIGVGIVIPSLPFYAASFGASAFSIAMLFSVFSFCAFLGSPLLGYLSDRFGRRPILIISLLTTSIGWFFFAGARSLIFLFIGRIVDGSASGSVSAAQSYLTDISHTDKDRTQNLGLIGAAFGIGFILGPMLGGVLSAISPTFPFWLSGFLALANAISVYFFLPETNKNLDNQKKISFNPIAPFIRAAKNKPLLPIYTVWILFILAISIMQSILALYLEDVFHYGSFEVGLFMAGMGVVIALNQAVVLKHFWLKYFEESKLGMWMLLISAIGFLFIGSKIFFVFVAGFIITAFGHSLIRILTTSQVAGASEKNERGEALGMLSSLSFAAMAIGPIISGLSFQKNISYPFLVSAFFMLSAFLISLNNKRKLDRLKLSEDATPATF
jgi:DHA1 family tetracycline resistance protein-like MFS transporter